MHICFIELNHKHITSLNKHILYTRAGLGQQIGTGILAQTGPLHIIINTTEYAYQLLLKPLMP